MQVSAASSVQLTAPAVPSFSSNHPFEVPVVIKPASKNGNYISILTWCYASGDVDLSPFFFGALVLQWLADAGAVRIANIWVIADVYPTRRGPICAIC